MTWREEPSFSQWVVLNIISAGLTFVVPMSLTQQAMIIAFGMLVLVVELLNTGIEAAIDRISEEIHPLSKKAKDAGCAAVGMMAKITGVIWVFVLIDAYR